MHGDSYANLTADTKTESDWILVSASETTSPPQTSFTFHRRYITTDPNVGQDYSITRVCLSDYISITNFTKLI